MDKLYLCNFKNPKCNESFFCGKNDDGECFHTLYKEYAKNQDSTDDNFDIYTYGDGQIFMVEKKEK